MKKVMLFVLFFFLFLFIQFNLVYGLARCRSYIDGVCQNDEEYAVEEVVEEEYVTPQPEVPKVAELVFQLIGLIALTILLIVLVQKLGKSKKRPKKSKR